MVLREDDRGAKVKGPASGLMPGVFGSYFESVKISAVWEARREIETRHKRTSVGYLKAGGRRGKVSKDIS